MKSVQDGDKPLDFTEQLKRDEVVQDKVLMGLRLKEGINISELEEKFHLNTDMNKIGRLVDDGFLENTNSSFRLTKKGTLLSNAVILKFVEALS